MEKSNRTIKAIHNYMDVVNNWLDDTDGKLNKVDSSKDELRNVIPLSALPSAEHSVDGGSKEEPVDQTKEDDEQPADKTWDAFEDIEASKTLSEDEKEQLQDTIEQMTIDIKVCASQSCVVFDNLPLSYPDVSRIFRPILELKI